MITINDIIAFIQEAMNKNCKIFIYSTGISINKYGKDKTVSTFDIGYSEVEGKLNLFLGSLYLSEISSKIIIEDTKDILRWKLLIEEVKSYCNDYIENTFHNFFKEDDNKPMQINELDDNE